MACCAVHVASDSDITKNGLGGVSEILMGVGRGKLGTVHPDAKMCI